MKIVYEMTGWRVARYGFLDWAGDYGDLQKTEKRMKDHLHSVQQYQINPVVVEPVTCRDRNETKLHAAAKYGHDGDVRRMIQNGEIDKETLNTKTGKWRTALIFAVDRGYPKVLDVLLDVQGAWTNSKNTDGMTALHLAARANRLSMVRKLLNKSAKPGVRDAHGMTALRGQEKGKGEDRVADLNQVTDKNGWSALHNAVDGNQLETVKWLIAEGIMRGIKIKGRKNQGLTAKMLAMELERKEILEGWPE